MHAPHADTPGSPHAASTLAVTLAPLEDPPRRAFERISGLGLRHVQLSAGQRGMRPRELDRSARRDLLAALRRHDLAASGLDLWIPAAHFLDAGRVDRAVAATAAAIDLAGDLGRVPVSLDIPVGADDAERAAIDGICATVTERADRRGVRLADHRVPDQTREGVGVGIDPAAWLAIDRDPAVEVARLAPRLEAVRLCDLLTGGQRGPIGQRGERRLDVAAYRVAVSVSGFDGPVVVDGRQWVDPWGGLAQSIEAWGDAGSAS